MHSDDTALLIAAITDAVELRLRAEENPLVADRITDEELRGQIARLVGRVLSDLGLVGPVPLSVEAAGRAPIGAQRARQGIHPSASLAAADALFDVALREIAAAIPGTAQFELARSLNAAIRSEVTRASTEYVDELVARLDRRPAPLGADAHPSPLTTRELEVLRLMAHGHSNRRIGAELTITEGTVKRHAGSIYDKLEARSRLDAVRIASAIGIL